MGGSGNSPERASGVPYFGRDLGGGAQQRLDRRLEEVAEAVGGGYCRLRKPLSMALAIRVTVAAHTLGFLGGVPPPPSNASLGGLRGPRCSLVA